jgi:hypothetical protein
MAVAAWAGRDLEGPGAAMPRLLTAALCALLLGHLIIVASTRGVPSQSLEPDRRMPSRSAIGWVTLFMLTVSVLGFAGGTAVSSVAYARLGASESWTKSVLMAIGLTIVVCALLTFGLGGVGLVRGLR